MAPGWKQRIIWGGGQMASRQQEGLVLKGGRAEGLGASSPLPPSPSIIHTDKLLPPLIQRGRREAELPGFSLTGCTSRNSRWLCLLWPLPAPTPLNMEGVHQHRQTNKLFPFFLPSELFLPEARGNSSKAEAILRQRLRLTAAPPPGA